MSQNRSLSKFPDISDKLNAPKKLSIFERERQEAESKRLREAAATRKALQDFEQSFAPDDQDDDHDDDDDDPMSRLASARGAFASNQPPPGPRAGPANSRARSGAYGGERQVAEFGMLSGPPPNLLKRKRQLAAFEQERAALEGPRRLAPPTRQDHQDNQTPRSPDSTTVRRPTALLQSLPVAMTEAQIRAMMPSTLAVEHVTFIDRVRGHTRRTRSALLVTSAHTPVSEIDSAVSALQSKYLGFGCSLKISRHISLLGGQQADANDIVLADDSQPFGARPAVYHPQQSQSSMKNAPPPRDFDNRYSSSPAHTSNPASRHRGHGGGAYEIAVSTPSDLRQLRLVHRTVEQLLTHGEAFEAVLMSLPEIQHDDKWAWLYDATSECGVYYRWLLWKHAQGDTIMHQTPTDQQPALREQIFESGPRWVPPTEQPRYSHVVKFEQLVDDSAYESSEDESGDDGPVQQRQFNKHKHKHDPAPPPSLDVDSLDQRPHYLNPYRRAKLTHLLARLPDTIALLRAGDVARVTNFVVKNAGNGADEIVDMLLSNIEHPFRLAVCYNDNSDDETAQAQGPEGIASFAAESALPTKKEDTSNQKLINLYLVSDVLQASSVSGVRDAWKYRTLFESALAARKTFEHLGRLEKDFDWGRMKAEQWKRKINVVLSLWEQRSIFPKEAHEEFKKSFNDPPLTEADEKAKERDEARPRKESEKADWKMLTDKGVELKSDQGPQSSKDLVAQKVAAIKQKAEAAAAAPSGTSSASRDSATTGQTRGAFVSPAADADWLPAASNVADADPHQQATHRRNRPTAAELNDAPPVTRPAVPLGFSLSLSSSDRQLEEAGGVEDGRTGATVAGGAIVASQRLTNMFEDESD